MGLKIQDVPLTINLAPQMTLTFGVQTPSSSSAVRVEKLVGHSRCEDGLLTDAVLPSVWMQHHVKTAKITDVSALTLSKGS
jgi:hypothetical protein